MPWGVGDILAGLPTRHFQRENKGRGSQPFRTLACFHHLDLLEGIDQSSRCLQTQEPHYAFRDLFHASLNGY